MQAEIDRDTPVRSILRTLAEIAERRETVTLGDVIETFGEASFVPALLVPALLVVSPLSGVPLFSSLCGLTIAAISLQMAVGRRHLWLPGVVRRRPIPARRFAGAVRRIGPAGDWLDRVTRPRLQVLFLRPLRNVAELLCVACGAAMPVLELVPFSATTLGAAVVCFAVGFLARDGALTLAATGFVAVAAALPFVVLSQVGGG